MTDLADPVQRARAVDTAGKRSANLGRLMRPRHIAVIGGQEAEVVIRQCESVGYAGTIWPVNPKRDTIAGRPCFASLEDLPEAPDAAFVGVPARITPGVVAELASLGAGGAVCYAAGFAERGAEGAALQQALIEAAGDMALVGPNCYGLLNYLDGAALWPDGHGGRGVERGVALVMQSGNIALNMTMQHRGVPISYVVSVGNQACLSIGDYVDALLDDERVTAIGLYIEGLNDVEGFAKSAAKALERGVPLVALKTGNSEKGAQFTLSHTASLAGSEAVYDALLERLGIVRVDSLSCLLETLKLLHFEAPLAGPRIAVLCCSGGEASLISDLAARHGLELPELIPAQNEVLSKHLSDFVTQSNPLDYNTEIWGNREALGACFGALMEGDVDAGVLLLDYPRPDVFGYETWHASFEALLDAKAAHDKPAIVLSTLSELLPEDVREAAGRRGAVPLQGLEDGVKAMAASARYGARRRAIADPQAAADLLVPHSRVEGAHSLDEWDSKTRLKDHGLQIPQGRAAKGFADAVAAAEAIGGPVALKALSANLAHKSEAGAVALNLIGATAVAEAGRRIAAGLGQDPETTDYLVEAMVADGVCELIVGIERNAQFGLVLVVGSGGVLVELVGDSKSLLLPTTPEDILAALKSLKAWRLLGGFRNRPPGDVEAAIQAIVSVAHFAEAQREDLVELDVNPLIVRPKGRGAVAADALIRLRAD